MKTTLNIPDNLIFDVMKTAKVQTKKAAVILALKDYLQKQKMIKIANQLGTFTEFINQDELAQMRENRTK